MTQAQELKSLLGEEAERRAFIQELARVLPVEHHLRLKRILELIGWLLDLLDSKNLSIARLRKLCFGPCTESTSKGESKASRKKNKPARGHGRLSHRAYTGARRVKVSHPTLRVRDRCPECTKGKLRLGKEPAIAIELKAQALVGAVVHEMERLRCDTCGKVFTAPCPPEAASEKYDPSVGAMIALMRYGGGMPFYRLEKLQASLGVPLSSSVQWEQVNRVAQELEGLLDHLIYLAAQSSLIYSDDTTMRVMSLGKEIQSENKPKRTGIFTTGIVSQSEEYPMILFFTGRAHAGENLKEVLDQRDPGRSPPLHMCDGLDRNVPKDHPTIPCQCNVHGRRNFVEIENDFPQESRFVIECLAEIYRVEAQAASLNDQQRLELHQAKSQPVMNRLKTWLNDQIQDRKAEPNSNLGQAIGYMQERWTELTRFLTTPGAPLDNNVTERILKMSILHRKNSMFYRTARGAAVGDLFMSLIQTCRANQVNPFDYMLAALRNAKAVKNQPGLWMPWNYHLNLIESATQPA